jgi:hypothetical protein
MIQITPQMRVLVAVEAVDFRKGIDALAQLCRNKLAADPFSGLRIRVPFQTRDVDQGPGLRRHGILVGYQTTIEGQIPLVARRGDSAGTASTPGAVVVCSGQPGFGGGASVAESELKKELAF